MRTVGGTFCFLVDGIACMTYVCFYTSRDYPRSYAYGLLLPVYHTHLHEQQTIMQIVFGIQRKVQT